MDILRQVDFTLGPLWTSFLLGFTTIILFYWYSTRNQDYWKKIGIPYVKPYPFFGSLLDNIRKPIHETELDRYNKYGTIFGLYEGNRAVLSVAEPELIRNILVKDFASFTGRRVVTTGSKVALSTLPNLHGEDWKRVRSIVTPAFTTGKLKRMMGIFKDCAGTLKKNFRAASEKGDPVDVKSLYGAFTMDVIASSAFSTKIDSHNDPNNEFVATAKAFFTKNINWRQFFFILMPGLMKFFGISVASPESQKFFINVTRQIIEARKRTGETRNDFLQLLLDIAKESSDEGKLTEKDDITENYGKDDNTEIFKSYLTKKTLSQDELVAQCITFFLAGYDTTASTLSFTSYLLALNPDAQEKLIQEVDDVLRANDGELTYEAVRSMKYLDNVIAETMRIIPPAIRLERIADEDYKLGDTGLTVPKGMLVTVPVYGMHRDPKLFPNPEKFDPDRFSPEERTKQTPYSYLPFGAGPRNCIGMRFALIEVKVCLAHIISNFRIKRCPQTKVPLDFYIGNGLLQPKNITLVMELREDAVKAL